MTRNAAASAAASSGVHQDSGPRRHRLGDGAGARAHHRQAVTDRGGERHPVAFMARRQDEDIGVAVQRGEFVLPDGAAHAHPRAEAARGDLRGECVRRGAIAGAIAGNDQPPVEIRDPGERVDEYVVALARHHRADREQHDGVAARPRRCGDPVIARQGDGDRRVARRRNRRSARAASTGW